MSQENNHRDFNVDYGASADTRPEDRARIGDWIATPMSLRGRNFYRIEQFQVVNGEVVRVFIEDQYLTEPMVKGDQAFHLYRLTGGSVLKGGNK